jgi:hypothetical protein
VALSAQLQAVLVTLGIVIALASVLGVSIKITGTEVSGPTGKKTRGAGSFLGVLVAAFAFWNPYAHSFEVLEAKLYAAPLHYEGRCPVSASLVGVIRASNGSGHVTSDLVLTQEGRAIRNVVLGGHHLSRTVMKSGDSVVREIPIKHSSRDLAHFIVLAPQKQEAELRIDVKCTKHGLVR